MSSLISIYDAKLNDLQLSGETQRRTWINELVSILESSSSEFATTFIQIFTVILHEQLNIMEASWRSRSEWYVKQHSILIETQSQLERVVKTRMGHPAFKSEIDSVKEVAGERQTRFDTVVSEYVAQMQSDFKGYCESFADKLEYVSSILFGCLNAILTEHDIKRPQGDHVHRVVDDEAADSGPTSNEVVIESLDVASLKFEHGIRTEPSKYKKNPSILLVSRLRKEAWTTFMSHVREKTERLQNRIDDDRSEEIKARSRFHSSIDELVGVFAQEPR